MSLNARDLLPDARDTPQSVRFSVRDYYKMAEVGVLSRDKRYELIRGVVLETQPISPAHNYAVKSLSDQLSACLGEDATVFAPGPLQLDGDSEPQPDLLVLKPPAERYRERHPTASDVLLLIEVSNATLQTDRTTKLQLYAGAGIPEYWILNLQKPQLEMHRDPDRQEARYREVKTLSEGEVAAFGSCEVAWWR